MPDNSNEPGSRRSGQSGPGVPKPKVSPWILIAALLIVLVAFQQWFRTSSTTPSFGQFQKALDANQIPGGSTVKISDASITWTQDENGQQVEHTATLSSNFQTQDLVKTLSEKGIVVQFVGSSIWVGLLINFVPFLILMFLLYWFLFRRMGG